MAGFQKIIMFSAIIVLIVLFIFFAIALSQASSAKSWPPIASQCPDYWKINGSGDNLSCTNTKNLGTCKDQHTMNFNTPLFSGANGNCAKYTWANNCKVSWDGITYGTNNPCQI